MLLFFVFTFNAKDILLYLKNKEVNNMKFIDVENMDRKKAYKMFKSFGNATYGCSVEMDVTKLVALSKQKGQSFFLNTLYLVCRAINDIDEMRMRLVDDKPAIYEKTHPGFTVMTDAGFYVNTYTTFYEDYKKFYDEAKISLDSAKKNKPISEFPNEKYGYIYISSLPWISFTQMTHPIPESQSSQCIPRVCWGKYFEKDGKLIMSLNITVSHIFVDGYPLSKTFLEVQEYFENAERWLK